MGYNPNDIHVTPVTSSSLILINDCTGPLHVHGNHVARRALVLVQLGPKDFDQRGNPLTVARHIYLEGSIETLVCCRRSSTLWVTTPVWATMIPGVIVQRRTPSRHAPRVPTAYYRFALEGAQARPGPERCLTRRGPLPKNPGRSQVLSDVRYDVCIGSTSTSCLRLHGVRHVCAHVHSFGSRSAAG
jgi:hypothetical protein